MKNLIYIIIITSLVFVGCSDGNSDIGATGNTGVGGSFARFAINNNLLYAVNNTSLRVYDITNPANPNFLNTVNLGVGIETLFAKDTLLFVGSNSGMDIYEIGSNPQIPQYVNGYDHAVGCDPVIANDSLAFVTVRSGTSCGRNVTINQLDVVDLGDLSGNLDVVSSISMNNPRGLGFVQDKLVVCDGTNGLVFFDYSDPNNLTVVQTLNDFETFDVISLNNTLMVVGPDRFCQYDVSNIDSIFKLSDHKFLQ